MWYYNFILQVKHFYCCWQSFRHWPLGPGPLHMILQISHMRKWAQVPSSFLCLPSTPLLCNCVFILSVTASLCGPSRCHCLCSYISWYSPSLSFFDPCGHWTQTMMLSPRASELLWLCCVPVASHSKACMTKAHCLFLHEGCHVPFS